MAIEQLQDDIMADVNAAMTEVETGAPPPPPEPAPEAEAPAETAQQAADRARDEQGRFAKKEAEEKRTTLSLKEKPQASKPTAPTAPAVASPPAAPAAPPEIDKAGKHLERIPPPAAWKGGAKVEWDRIPRPVREELAAKYAEVETAAAELAPLKDLIDANREFLVNEAGSVVEGQRQLMQMARMASTVDGAIQVAQHVLRARGLDPRAVFGGQPQAPAGNQQPDIGSLVAQAVQQHLQPIVAQTQQRETQQLQSQIDQFASDPAHPYFNDVRVQMGVLIEKNLAKDMKDAYEQAVWANPTIRSTLMQQQTEEAAKTKAAEAAKARTAAAASLRGSPIPGAISRGNSNSNSSVHDDVRAAVQEIAGA